MSLTDDPNDPRLIEGQKNTTGQHSIYLVLSEEERAKGFVRPYRDCYVHVGEDMSSYGEKRELTEDEVRDYSKYGYVAFVPNIKFSDGLTGRFLTKDNAHLYKNGRLGGCGTETKMGSALAETYAREPSFYGATFCIHCNKHLPVDEFVWSGTNERVGS